MWQQKRLIFKINFGSWDNLGFLGGFLKTTKINTAKLYYKYTYNTLKRYLNEDESKVIKVDCKAIFSLGVIAQKIRN